MEGEGGWQHLAGRFGHGSVPGMTPQHFQHGNITWPGPGTLVQTEKGEGNREGLGEEGEGGTSWNDPIRSDPIRSILYSRTIRHRPSTHNDAPPPIDSQGCASYPPTHKVAF